MAGLIKAVLALYHKVLPPTLHVDEPNPRLGLERTPFYLNTETRPVDSRRRASRAAPASTRSASAASTPTSSSRRRRRRARAPRSTPSGTAKCVCSPGVTRDEVVGAGAPRGGAARARTCAGAGRHRLLAEHARAGARSVRASPWASSRARPSDLARKLDRALEKLDRSGDASEIKDASGIYYFDEPLARQRPLAFVFPGEGAQYVNMLSDLCRHFPGRPRVLRRDGPRAVQPPARLPAQRVRVSAAGVLGRRTRGRRPPPVDRWTSPSSPSPSPTTRCTLLLQQLGIVPDVILGHSSGEYLGDACRRHVRRGRLRRAGRRAERRARARGRRRARFRAARG